jgi:adenosine deaminase
MFSYDAFVKLPGHVLGGSNLMLLAGHPVVLCTDDQGVFQTSLSKECAIAAQAFQLTEDDLWTLVLRSVDYTFLSKGAKAELTDLMQRRRDASSTAKQS